MNKMSFLTGKRILITGLSSSRSIAYGIAKVLHREGAETAFTYQSERLKSRIEKIISNFNSDILLPCDVSEDSSIENLFFKLKQTWKTFDGFIHAIAYSPKCQLNGDYVQSVNRTGFLISHNISSYSFVAMAKASQSMLNHNSSLVTLTYIGSERVVPNYNVMGLAKASLEANTRYMANSMGQYGIRVNAISSGPIYTLAASGIKNIKKMLSLHKLIAPIHRSITVEDVGNVAAFLCSDLSSGITGEIIHVDGGFSITAMHELENTK